MNELTAGQLANELPNLFSFARSAAGLEYWAEVCRRLEAEQQRQDAQQPVKVSSVTVTLDPEALYQGQRGTVNMAVASYLTVMLTGPEAAKLGHALITKGHVLQEAADEQPVYVDVLPHFASDGWLPEWQRKVVPGSPVSERRVPRMESI